MQNLIFVAAGGAVGATLRYLASLYIPLWLGKDFPYATLLVNVVGSFIMGVLFSLLEHGIVADLPWRSLFGIGLLGALTTFSTFSLDTVLLLKQGFWHKAMLNMVLNVTTCLLAAWLGMQLVPNRT